MKRGLVGLRTVCVAAAWWFTGAVLPSDLAAQGPPAAPINLAAVPSATSVRLTWDRDPNSSRSFAVAFRVYRDGGSVGTTFSESYTDTGLQIGQEYTYRVSGIDIAGREGALSAPVDTRTIDDSAPTSPGDLVADAQSATRIDLSWSAAEDEESGVQRYYVYRNGASQPVDSTSALSYSDTGLAAFTLYSYRVTAVNSSGLEGPPSNQAQATTFDITPPTAPGDLVAVAGSTTRIDVSWSPASDPESGVASYRVYRDGSGTAIETTEETSYSDEVEAGAEHTYEVAAVNGVGLEGPRAGPVAGRALDDTPPTAPGNLVAEAGPSGVALSWEDAADEQSGVAMYLLYRSPNLTPFDSTAATAFVDTQVEPATEYSYRVSARNGDGVEGPQGNVAQVLTPAEPVDTTPPAPPTGLRVVGE